jgi:NADPH-dependent 2,4-dienoyl-CoA reductase/sulfur reductase-like enzyme
MTNNESATVVIAGAGHATAELVTALRQASYSGRIVAVGDEAHLPYQRPPSGKQRPHNAVPWFWSDQYHLKLQMAGLSQGYDQLVVCGSTGNESFAAFYLRQGKIISADTVNRPQEFMIAKRLVAEGVAIDPRLLGDESVPLKTLLPK